MQFVIVFLMGLTVVGTMIYRDRSAWALYGLFGAWCILGLVCSVAAMAS